MTIYTVLIWKHHGSSPIHDYTCLWRSTVGQMVLELLVGKKICRMHARINFHQKFTKGHQSAYEFWWPLMVQWMQLSKLSDILWLIIAHHLVISHLCAKFELVVLITAFLYTCRCKMRGMDKTWTWRQTWRFHFLCNISTLILLTGLLLWTEFLFIYIQE